MLHTAAMGAIEVAGEADLERRFGAVERLIGAAAFAKLRAAHVVIVGIGGVGTWAAEALARSAVGRLTLVDLDHVSESNTNRQIHALDGEYGKAKVRAMAERIVAINPACRVECIEDFMTPDNLALVPGCDALVDCIDQVSVKAALLAHCRAARINAITCGAAGGRLDPMRIRQDDLARVSGDPLLAKVRYRLRRHYGFPREGSRVRKFGIDAVYSDEPIASPRAIGSAGAPLACAGYGSSVAVTAPFGFAAAAVAMRMITGANKRDCEASPIA